MSGSSRLPNSKIIENVAPSLTSSASMEALMSLSFFARDSACSSRLCRATRKKIGTQSTKKLCSGCVRTMRLCLEGLQSSRAISKISNASTGCRSHSWPPTFSVPRRITLDRASVMPSSAAVARSKARSAPLNGADECSSADEMDWRDACALLIGVRTSCVKS
jgi:hypothetical protein